MTFLIIILSISSFSVGNTWMDTCRGNFEFLCYGEGKLEYLIGLLYLIPYLLFLPHPPSRPFPSVSEPSRF